MSVIKGLFRAKLRTILNLIIMIAVAVAVCITLNVPFGTGGAQKEFPENSITQSEQEDNSLTASSTASNHRKPTKMHKTLKICQTVKTAKKTPTHRKRNLTVIML